MAKPSASPRPNRLWSLIVVLACGAISSSALAADPDTPQEVLARIGDPKATDEDAIGFIKAVLLTKPSSEERDVLARVANSEAFSPFRRRHAVFQLFERHVSNGMTIKEVVDVLSGASWLNREGVLDVKRINSPRVITGGGGLVPLDGADGERIFVTTGGILGHSNGIYLRIKGEPSERQLHDALKGSESRVAQLKISAIAVFSGDTVKH